MSKQISTDETATILDALSAVQRRLQALEWLQRGMLLAAMVLAALLGWRLLRLSGAALSAVIVLVLILALVAGLYGLLRSLLRARPTLALAAARADAQMGLHEGLSTACWFIGRADSSSWVVAQRQRAAQHARMLDLALIVPLRVSRLPLFTAAAAMVLIAVSWPLTPWSTAMQVASNESIVSVAQSERLRTLRALLAELPQQHAAARAIAQALAVLEQPASSEAEQREALNRAQEAIEQGKLQAASAREGMYRLAQRLRGVEHLEEIADALEHGDAQRAAQLLQREAQSAEHAADADARTSAVQSSGEKELDRLMREAAESTTDPLAQQASSAAAKEAVDRLQKIAEQLAVQGQANQAASALQQLQLSVAQRSTLSAGRFSQQAAANATPSPETGNTAMAGGTMYRAAAVAQESRRSEQQEGSKTGSALGDSPADELFGRNSAPLAAQLKRETIADAESEQAAVSQSWFYTESAQQSAQLDYRAARTRADFARAQSGTPEGIPLHDRQTVKDYFMKLREAGR